MGERRSIRRNLLVVVAVVALFVSAAGVVALAQGDEGEVFTGCVNENSGVLKSVAVGSEPAKPCNDEEIQITWDRAGPAFEDRIADLEERVAELEEPFGALELFVDCAAGDTVAGALAEARTHLGPVHIAISGVCEEDVFVERDHVHLQGVSPESGVRAASPDGFAVSLQSVRDVSLNNMTISGGRAGVYAIPGSHFAAHGLTVRDSHDGISVAGSVANLYDCTIRDNTLFGLSAGNGSAVSLQDCLVTGNPVGLWVSNGGDVRGGGLDITGNDRGVEVQSDGTVDFGGSTIDQNVWGVSVSQNGTAWIRWDSRVADNEGDGVLVRTGGVFMLADSVVEGNGGYGIHAAHASTVVIEGSSVLRSNTKDGILLGDQSNGAQGLFPGGVIEIRDNGGWGINCAGPAAIASVQNQFIMANIQFSGNTNGDTNCP